ncbi:MFS transporter [Microbacterium sp. AK031]|uniref:MFS transporter n=1 Tax=Microbacterium sp. AK031 TaxID=2723076 RepID=UPI00216A3EB0|nr:MFS transporter [Microbacterium sp. AK031]MCS3842895.1 MFS family permease [Microbacterium sp. AK031]
MTAVQAPPRLGGRLAALSVGQVVSWGILFYALIVASPAIADDTGWSVAFVTLSFSSGLVVSALAGVFVGRWLDARGPHLIMTLGSILGPIGIVAVALAPSPMVFTAGWVIAGIAQSAVLYQAAFTVIARRYGARRRGAMTILTLAGGLASTVFAPIVAGLLTITDWRTTFLLLAGVLLITTVPLHWFSLERTWTPIPHDDSVEVHSVSAVVRTRRFWMLELSMLTLAAALFSVTLALIPLFAEKGMSYELAAWALGLLGAGQVIGRLLYVAIPHTAAPWIPLAATAALSTVFLALLALVPGPPWLLISIGIATGAVRGAQTLVQGSAVADRWGARNYGAINGVFAAPITLVGAFGPAIGPLLAVATGSYSAMALIAVALAALSLAFARFS